MALSALDEYQLKKLLAKIQADRSLDFSGFRLQYLGRRVRSRLVATNTATMREYLHRLDADPEEYLQLLDALTVNVSEFFRDRAAFDFIGRRVVPEVIQAKAGRSREMIRVWSAGCSTGEEPYSIGMLILDALSRAASQYEVTITATDIDPNVLETARQGRYPLAKLSQVPGDLRHKYCIQDDDGFVMSDELRSIVRFRRLDLFADNPIGAIDLILCRNVMIYFDRKKQVAVLAKFVDALRKGGFLVIGKSEKLPAEISARLVGRELREHVYQRP
jgi:chemotaxis methyl-accepting protein methylase